jgi:Zn-finger nucleic acid-binding protein
MQMGALHCPTCGAAVDSPDIRQCAYCGTQLASVQCAACFGTMFVGNRFCPHCGAAAAQRSVCDTEKLPCPRCTSATENPLMEPAIVGSVQFDECTKCGGIWADLGTFQKILTSEAAQVDALNMLGPNRQQTERLVRYLKCPVCKQQMFRRNYARRSGIIVDLCTEHGLWFDRDELRKLIEFIRTGGLAEAAELEADRVRAELERKEHEQRYLNDDPHAEAKRREFSIGASSNRAWLHSLFTKMNED